MKEGLETATFGGGCFWCIEAIFFQIKGVEAIKSGYSGGNVPGKPSYREVCSGLTGHAEVVQISFDPQIISYHDILVIFITSHDPTTLNRQGGDVGTQYRSVIFFHSEKQKEVANSVIAEVKKYFENPIVTEISKFTSFFEAEQDHQEYYENNKSKSYCQAVITPKLFKLRKEHSQFLK